MPDYDDLDQRLRAYEARIPDTDGDAPSLEAGSARRGTYLGAIAAGGAIVGVVVAVFLLGRPAAPVGEASQTLPASALSGSAVPSVSAPSAAATAAATPTPSPAASPVAVTWQPIFTPAQLTDETAILGVAESTDGLIVFGRADHTHGGIWLSTDGVEWQATTVPESPAGTVVFVTDVIRFEEHYLAFGTLAHPEGSGPLGGVLWSSPDGRAWTELSRDYPGAFVGTSGEAILAEIPYEVPTADDLLASYDGGLTWTPVDRPDPWHIGGEAITYDGRLLLPGGVVGDGIESSTAAIWSSIDAVAWDRADLGGMLITHLVALPDGSLIAISSTGDAGDSGRVWLASPGGDWELVSEIGVCCASDFATTPNAVVGVGFLDDDPPAGVEHALITTTSDGLAWSNYRIDGYLNGAIWTERLGTVLVGRDPDNRPGLIIGWQTE